MPSETEKKPVEKTLLDLLIHDLQIDREIMRTLIQNVSATRTWLVGIGNLKTREQFRLFLEDTQKVMRMMDDQRGNVLDYLFKSKDQWNKLQRQQSESVKNVEEPKLTSSEPSPSCAQDAGEQEKSPASST